MKRTIGSRMKKVWGTLLVAAAAIPGQVLAVLPDADDVADGVSTTSPIDAGRGLFTVGITIAATAVAAVLVLGAMWQIYTSFVKGREKGDWKEMGLTTFVGVAIMAGGVIMAVLAVEYGTFA